jgi:uncharacterized protein (TIGR02271 family)
VTEQGGGAPTSGPATPGHGVVVDAEGVTGSFVEVDDASPEGVRAAIQFESGRRILVPRSLLLPQGNGRFFIPLSLAKLAGDAGAPTTTAEEPHVIALAEEQVTVGKRRVARASVRVKKRVNETRELVDFPLLKERVEVRHVPVGRWVDGPASVRQDGDTLILPVMEEVLVIEKRLRLVEEVHVIKHRQTVQHRESIARKRETADVERISLSGGETSEAGDGDRDRPDETTTDINPGEV